MKKSGHTLTYIILGAMLVGVVTGQFLFMHFDVNNDSQLLGDELTKAKDIAAYFKLLTTHIFLRPVQMTIAPLVLTTLIAGIAKMDDIKTVGRVGGRSMIWFLSASLVSLFLGLVLVNYFQPGVNANFGATDASSVGDIVGKTQGFSLQNFLEHVFPMSVFEALAHNEILQIVLFAVLFAIALNQTGEKAKPIIDALDTIGKAILKIVGYVMWLAPLGVFGGITAIIAVKGLVILKLYKDYLIYFYTGIGLLWILLLGVGYLILKGRLWTLISHLRNPLMVAFSTTSSEAVFPKLSQELENFGCKKKVVSFVLPLGYSFNLDGSMMYMTFASIFIAQAYNVPLSLGTQLTMLLVLMLTSKGIAGVPRASLVVVAATCSMFNIPVEGIALILPIDHFCDMGRSMTNVLGNGLAISAIDKWEKE
ncbi:MAG: dicarboxylate/amino acid:cation symporter [Bacteroidia bacterium]|nr:dicarboxylate/amino acid:cation symporter [Bacteroidia bacterium]